MLSPSFMVTFHSASSALVTGRPLRFSTASRSGTQRASWRFKNFLNVFDHFNHPSRSPPYFSGRSMFLWLMAFNGRSGFRSPKSSLSKRPPRVRSSLTLRNSASNQALVVRVAVSCWLSRSIAPAMLSTCPFRSATSFSAASPGGLTWTEAGPESGTGNSVAALDAAPVPPGAGTAAPVACCCAP